MNILWLCNIPLPQIATDLNMPIPVTGGWLKGMANCIKNNDEYKLAVCFPKSGISSIQGGEIDGISYYAFPEMKRIKNEKRTISYFDKIIKKFSPDLVHIFGTEVPHSLAMTKAFSNPDKTVINIQGLCYIYAQHFMGNIPKRIQYKYTLIDFLEEQISYKKNEISSSLVNMKNTL